MKVDGVFACDNVLRGGSLWFAGVFGHCLLRELIKSVDSGNYASLCDG